MRGSVFLLAVLSASACKPPPPAPEGLDASAKYMVRNFYADDATFQAGIEGFLAWFEDEGKDLVGLGPDENAGRPTDAFTVNDLEADDVALLPLDDEIVLAENNPDDDADDEMGARDLSKAPGVVSVAEMNCTWKDSEKLLVRPDQHNVFVLDWEGYERTYETPRETFETATADEDFTEINEAFNPSDAGFVAADYAKSVLLTQNMADPTPLMGVDIPAYPLRLELRHGVFTPTDGGDDFGVFAILTYDPGAVWGPTGDNGLVQEFSIEINVQRPGNKTLRTLAVWAQPESPIIGADSVLALNYAVNKSLKSSQTLSDVCDGTTQIDAE